MDQQIDEEFVLGARNLHRHYRVAKQELHVLKGVNTDIREGEILFLCGASGAGKTTLLYTLAGLERPDKGAVYVQGRSLYRCPKRVQAQIRNRMMGYVFQNYFLLPELTALENVLLPALINKTFTQDRAMDLLGQVGLGARLNHLPAELSGGEQQRVAIARALICDPKILFADEPTGNLDAKTGRAIMQLLLDLARAKAKTLVVVTHDPNLARLGDRTLHLADGRLLD